MKHDRLCEARHSLARPWASEFEGWKGEKCWMARDIDRFYGKQSVRDHEVIVGSLVFKREREISLEGRVLRIRKANFTILLRKKHSCKRIFIISLMNFHGKWRIRNRSRWKVMNLSWKYKLSKKWKKMKLLLREN